MHPAHAVIIIYSAVHGTELEVNVNARVKLFLRMQLRHIWRSGSIAQPILSFSFRRYNFTPDPILTSIHRIRDWLSSRTNPSPLERKKKFSPHQKQDHISFVV
jgi:hypothetical protein